MFLGKVGDGVAGMEVHVGNGLKSSSGKISIVAVTRTI
jgi:hypothetical protein